MKAPSSVSEVTASDVAIRCISCRLNLRYCICNDINPLQTRTRVSIVIHSREFSKSINTGHLTMRCLKNSEVLLLGRMGSTREDALPELLPGYHPVLLFPDGIPIEQIAAKATSPIQLIVPDGSWRQGRKMAAFLGSNLGISRASLPLFESNVYSRIRATKGGGSSTLGAIASALGVLEGVETEQILRRVLEVFVSRVVASRCFHESARIIHEPAHQREEDT